MITGAVKDGKACIRLKVIGSRGQEQEVEAVVDTGCTESLTLPSALVTALGLRWQGVDSAILADGNECFFELYEAKVMWDGKAYLISVAELGTTPLVGMALLDGYELKMQVRPGGKVTIKRLPERPKARKQRE
jgi:clan AA aspartic protease